MNIRHQEDAEISLTFDAGVWETASAPAVRAGPVVVGGMSGQPIAAAADANSGDPDVDWLLQQVSSISSVKVTARALDLATAPTVTVGLAADESAALLVECEGVVAWQFPEHTQSAPGQTRAPGDALRQVRFQVRAPSVGTASTPQQRNVFTDWMLDRVRTVVLKFTAERVAGVIVTQLEKDKRPGPVLISPAGEASEWEKPRDFSAVPLPGQNARVLLFVHGTFSSTAGGFGDLCATPWGLSLLQKADAKYDALLGFDHLTLSVEPSENARALYAALRTLRTPQPPTIDIVCHSRGALVIRWMIEKILPTATWRPKIGKVVFVGSTNAGTELARPENWHALLDLVTNLALAGRRALSWMGAPQAGFAAGELVKGVGDFVRYLVDAAVQDKLAPGLAAMDPKGAFIADINSVETGAPTPANTQYFAVTSSFRPMLVGARQHEPKEFPRRLALMLANGFIGALMKKAENDLVVNVGSMSSIDPVAGQYVKEVRDFGINPLVYHTNYFVQPETVDSLAGWLGLAPVHAVEAVNTVLVDPKIIVVEADTLVKDAVRQAEAKDASYVVVRRPDPQYPGTLHYAPSLRELRHLRQYQPDASIAEALEVRESRRSRVVENAPFLRSLSDLSPAVQPGTMHAYSYRAVLVEGDKPVGVIPEPVSALNVLKHATAALDVSQPSTAALDVSRPRNVPLRMPINEAIGAALDGTLPRAEPAACNAQAEMPPTVQVGGSATVTVTLSADEIAPTPGALSASTPTTLETRPVVVEVVPKVGFRLKSENLDDSRVRFDAPPKAGGQPFVMDVEVLATDEGPGEIWVIVRQGPVRTATLILRPLGVRGPAVASGPRLMSQGAVEAEEDLPEVATLEISEQRNGNETRFRFSVDVPGVAYNRFESPPIHGDIVSWVKALYADIEGAWLGSVGDIEIFHDQIKARGTMLFRELIPQELAALLWRLRRDGKLQSVRVLSDEPFVPWEIVYLEDPDPHGSAGGNAGACFFAELGLCRWLWGAVPATHIRLRPGRLRYVVPHYPEPSHRLPSAEEKEETMLRELGAQKVVPHYREVTAVLQTGEFDLLHFAGHGGAESGQIVGAAVLLEGSFQSVNGSRCYVTEPLAATVVAQKAKLCGPDRNRPLVFLNACQVGKLGFNLTSLGGFAPAFLGARVGVSRDVGQAGAFVSSLWSVGDQTASVFASAFYRAATVEGGTTIASAATAAREAARAAKEPTWLAYAVYAHPNCRLEFTP